MNAPEAKLSCPSGPSGHQSENKGMLQTERPAKHKSIPRTSLIPGSWPHADDGPYDSWDTEDSWEKKENSSEDTSGSSRKSSASQDWDQIGSPNTQPLPITRCKRPSNSPLKADGMKQEGPSVKWNDSGWDKKSLASTDSWGKKSDSDMISPKTAVPGSQNRQSWSDSQKEAQNYPSSWSSKHQQPPWNIGSAANTTEKKGKKLSNSWGVPFAVDAPAFATEPRHTSSRKRDSVKTTQAVASPVPVPCHQQRDSTPLSAFGIPVESILRLLSIGSKASTHVKTSAKKDLRNVTDEKPVEGRADGSNNPGEFKQKVKQNSPNDKTQVKGETDQHKSSWETGESKPEEAVEADTWDNGSGDVKEVENQGGTDWNNDSSGGTTWNNDNNEQSGEPTWGETAANDNQATGFGDTWGEEENKSTKPTSNSSKPRHHSSRHAVPSIIPKQHWSFPPPPPPRKFYPIPEEYKSTASNIRHSELWMFPAEPPLTIPTSAQKSGLEHHVQAGKGTQYIHHVGRPEYKDSFQNPYAVFRFKYRTRSFLRKQFGSDVVPVKESELIEDEEAEKARLKALGVQGLIEEILKLKADLKARGSNATPPSHVRDWVGEQRERSKKTHSSRVSSKKAGEENMGWREEGHGEKEELKPAWDRKSRGGSKKAESKVGSLVVGWADLQSGSKKAESEKRSRAGSRKASQVKGDWNRGDNEPEGNW
ncbi:hypothetical protein B0J11DRAFT_529872 [Dendryphion nanum]|uniref:Uncharacterized protein n=1 Tax=Dendryphion nanum TaxID=256645 RepID=A0A9P9IKG0_9PLEO|nr:hypothetical protein B0J11DRAFT_529872 [Dendryphion nanum]